MSEGVSIGRRNLWRGVKVGKEESRDRRESRMGEGEERDECRKEESVKEG